MKLFHCSHCGYVVFFDSFQCVHCASTLAFLPETLEMAALAPVDESEQLWQARPPLDAFAAARAASALQPAAAPESAPKYRLCSNRTAYNACNFTVAYDPTEPPPAAPLDGDQPAAEQPTHLCVSCQQTRILPDLSDANNQRRWTDIELAKRRLYYSLARLGLERIEGETGPVFEFLADVPGEPAVLTGHASGVITLNVAEADDDERARRRVALGEPYRTLLGHLRHESGHYFWDVLVLRGGHVKAFREVFGDERRDYAEALKEHYARTPDTAWQEEFVSAYARSHPWEDWAETWAHYLHMVDLLETAESYKTEVSVPGPLDAPRYAMVNPFTQPVPDFDEMLRAWVPLTLLLNSLTRSLGQLDAYPFALSAGAQAKLAFVHALVHGQLVPEPVQEPDASVAVAGPGTPDDALAPAPNPPAEPSALMNEPAGQPPVAPSAAPPAAASTAAAVESAPANLPLQ
ncbi:MAG: hypothetical protein EOO31_04480 [Comamonadaceae bacterium]|nr:MAG: hypothetical protein EOO31_04480 [Comamonadaceae bacterium]